MNRLKVIFFHRKPWPAIHFSVENLFRQVRNAMTDEVQWEVKEMTYHSKGFFKRLYICLEAAFYQKGINHITGDINFLAILLRKRFTVLTILDVGFMSHPNPVARFLLKWFWIKFPVHRAGVVTTISASNKKEILKYVNVSPDKIKVVYVPISTAFKHEPKVFNKSEPTILQVGTTPNKNVVRLVQALTGIRCKLEIVGVVNETLASELSAAGINFVASRNISNAEMLEKYQAADIISFVSTYEGFGMPIVEANAIGRVVVTSNVLSMPEVAGNAAHLVDPFDVASIRAGVLKVIADDTYRNELIANGFLNRNRFDEGQIAEEYTAIYRSLCPDLKRMNEQ